MAESKRRTLDEFLQEKFPPVEYLLRPWLPARGLVMLAGFRGVGKTFASLGVATAVAAGTPLLGWEVPAPRGVLLVDGEMDPAELQGRLRAIREGMGSGGAQAGSNLRILSHFDFENGIPNLADPMRGGRALVERAAADCDLIILDNLSTLTAPTNGDSNSADGWQSMQDWGVHLRRKGKSVIFIQHGGKPDETGRSKQRGTSKTEDVLNTSVILWRPKDGAWDTFMWEFTKWRGFNPGEPFKVRILEGGSGLERVSVGAGAEQEEAAKEMAIFLHGQGYSMREIEKRTGISKSTVHRILSRPGTA